MILRPPWTRQPQYPAPADMGQAATRLFDTLVNFNGPSGLKNLIQRDKAVSHSVAGFAARHSGMGLRSTGSGYVNLGQVGNYTSGSFFLVCRLMPESLASGPVGIFKGTYGSTGYYCHFQGDLQFYSGGTFTGTGAGKLVVGKTSTVVITVDVGVAAGCRIWVDGVDVTSGGGGTHSPTSSSNDLSLLAYNTSSNFLPSVLHMFGCGNQKMPQNMARWLSTGENVWQLFKPVERRIWAPSAAAPGTVALTGEAATSSAGTLVPSSAVAASGQASTSAAGTLAPSLAVALSGIAANASAGSVVQSATIALTGQAVTVSAGTLTYSTDGTVAVSGESAAASAGTVIPSVSVALAGQAATVSAGTLLPITPIAGQAASVSAGTLGHSISVTLSGAAVTSASGTLVASGGSVETVAAAEATAGRSWLAMVIRAGGKDYAAPDTAYEFTNRKFNDGRGPYG